MADRLTFTADQQRAIDARGHNILVAAAAGSGKTRVLVERIISQVRNEELSLDRILVLTFTKAAALEMRERIEAALNAEINAIAGDAGISKEIDRLERQRILLTGADISTFHSFCQRLLQAHIDATDIPPTFRLASEQEIRLLKRDVMDELLERKYEEAAQVGCDAFLSFADAYGGVKGDDEKLKEEVLALYDFALSQPSPAVWLGWQGQEEDDLPYWKRRGFDVLARELHEKLSDLCAG
uniref:UvrD-helicase domain-containing protein n=1 Tax=uncultured Selenomonas sp. TaxID=159275 RepID=UPI0028DC8A09